MESSIDVVSEIEKTLAWALQESNKAKIGFSAIRAGFRKEQLDGAIATAYKMLKKRGITKLPGFKDAWKLELSLAGEQLS